MRFTDCPIIAVTGSKGKSSTVSAIYYGLCQAGYKAFLGGNITVSPLTFFDDVNSDTPVVIEFSSWQLADLRGRGVLRPHISIITKIVPDHQNWYGNMEDYVADKRLIYADQTKGDYSIFDAGSDMPGTGPDKNLHPGAETWGNLFASETKATVLRYGKGKPGVWIEEKKDGSYEGKVQLANMVEPETILTGLSVPGEHMKTNVLNAALVMYLMGVPAKKTADICKNWPGIEHRLQFFHIWHSAPQTTVKFYNDSCATVPEAAAAATQAFGVPVILMTGGTDKGLELTPLIRTLTTPDSNTIQVKDLYLLAGSATDKLLPELDKAGVKYHGPFDGLEPLLTQAKKNLESAANEQAKNQNAKEQIFVFSPGATSFGMFTNEFDRGNKYMAEVQKIFQ